MNFSGFTKISLGNIISFKNSSPIQNIGSITFYKDDSSGQFLKKEFRWSFDGEHWSSWTSLTPENLKIDVNNRNLFLESKYTLSSPEAGKVSSFSIEYVTGSSQTPPLSIEKPVTKVVQPSQEIIPDKKAKISSSQKAFSQFSRISTGNIIIFRNESPIVDVGSIKFFKDNASGTFLKKEIKWSFNRTHWSSWEILNLDNISKIDVGDNKYLFLEARYTMSSPTAGKVSSFSIEYSINQGKTYAPPVESVNMDHGHILSDGCNDLGGTTKTFEVISITDAQTLCGKSCDFYLWRGNQKGTQGISTIEGLQNIINNLNNGISDSINNAINIDGSGSGVFFQKEGRNLVFKKINPGPGVYIAESDGIITVGVDSSLSTHDPSINDLYNLFYDLSLNLYDISIYIDYKFLNIELSINDLYLKDASSIKNASNVGGGVGEIFKGIVDQQIQFRTIASGSAALDVSISGDKILISFDASVSGETVWSDPTPVSANVGGIDTGNVIPLGENSIEILEKILYEYYPANISINLNPPAGYYQKWVDSPDISILGSFNNYNFVKSLIYDASIYINGVGYLNSINYPNVSHGDFEWYDPSPPYGSNWEDVIYNVKIYNKVGTTFMPPAEASAAIQFVNPYIWGVVDDSINIGNISSSILMNLYNSGNKLIVPKKSNEINFVRDSSIFKIKFVYAYDDSYGDLKTIFDVKNDFNVTSSFDHKVINLIAPWANPSPIPYKVYIKSHWIDVSSFKLIFNI